MAYTPPYSQIPSLYTPGRDNWDDLAQSPYLGIPGSDPSLNRYVTYDDPASITAKTAWAKSEGLAGMAFWELSLDYFAGRSIVSPLLNTIKVSYPKIALTSVTPGTPTGLTAAGVSAAGATLNWPAVGNANAYHVKRSSTSGGGYVTLARVTAPSYTDAALTSGQTYYYAVSALNNSVKGADSSQLAVTAAAGSAPAAPAGVSITAAAPTNTFGQYIAVLTWSAVSGAASYNIKRSAGVSGTDYAIAANVTGLSYTDGALTGNAAYYYVVTAVSSTGLERADSSQVSTATAAVYAPPNVLVSPAAIDASPWAVSGTGASASSASVIACAASGDTFLVQDHVPVAAATAYLAAVTVSAAAGCWCALTIFDAAYNSIAALGQYVSAGTPVTYRIPFNSGVNASVIFFLDCATGGTVSTVTVTGASIAADLPQIEVNLLTAPNDVTNAAWVYNPGTALSANSVACAAVPDSGKNVLGLSQANIPVAPNRYYLAKVSVVRTDTFTGDGGYAAFSAIGGGWAPLLGMQVTALVSGTIVDLFVAFNSGASSTVIVAFFLTGGAAGKTVTLSNLSVTANPYGGLT